MESQPTSSSNTENRNVIQPLFQIGSFGTIRWDRVVVGVIGVGLLMTLSFYIGHKWPVNISSNKGTILKNTQSTNTASNNKGSGNTNVSINPYSNWKSYTNSSVGYSYQYPSDWNPNFSPITPNQFNSNDSFTKDGYTISITTTGNGGAMYHEIAKSEAINLYGLDLSKVYFNSSNSNCVSSIEITVSNSTCANTFDTIFLADSGDVNTTGVPNINLEILHFFYIRKVQKGGGGGFNIQLKTPSPINISDIDNNKYIDTYNHFITTVDLANVH